MPNPALVPLLILQDLDSKRLDLEARLKAVPGEITQVERKITAENDAIESALAEVKELEAKKKLLETEIGSAEDKLGRYKTQQSLVRKNDEYQALGHEIENTEKEIGDFESRELEIMYAIDEAKKKFVAAEAEVKANISGHETRIRTLRERGASLAAELQSAQAAVAAARLPVGESRLKIYDRIAARNVLAIVAVRGSKCDGCHLKISSDIESIVRGKGVDANGQLPTCDQCGRIVYWES